jgi:hypothetical protein
VVFVGALFLFLAGVFSLACCTPPSTTCTICGLINFAASKIKCYVRISDTN